MAYVEPTSADLIARHPEFSAVATSRIDIFLDAAIVEIDDTWLDLDRAIAQIELACHQMVMAGEPAISGGSSAKTGPVERKKVGDVEIQYGKWGSGGSSGYSTNFYSTPYGVEYFRLLNRNHGGPRVI